jgi:hypothetical protein
MLLPGLGVGDEGKTGSGLPGRARSCVWLIVVPYGWSKSHGLFSQ